MRWYQNYKINGSLAICFGLGGILGTVITSRACVEARTSAQLQRIQLTDIEVDLSELNKSLSTRLPSGQSIPFSEYQPGFPDINIPVTHRLEPIDLSRLDQGRVWLVQSAKKAYIVDEEQPHRVPELDYFDLASRTASEGYIGFYAYDLLARYKSKRRDSGVFYPEAIIQYVGGAGARYSELWIYHKDNVTQRWRLIFHEAFQDSAYSFVDVESDRTAEILVAQFSIGEGEGASGCNSATLDDGSHSHGSNLRRQARGKA